MKRNLMLLFAVAVIFLSFGVANAATTITAKVEPLIDGKIALNDTIAVKIYFFNDYGEHAGGSIPFALFEKDGNPMNVQYIGTGTKAPIDYRGSTVTETFISESAAWPGYFNVYDDYTGIGCDAIFPDTLNWTGAGIVAWPIQDTTNHITFAMQILNEGFFCIDSCSVPNTTPVLQKFDWLWEDMDAFFLGASEGPSTPLCWEVVDTAGTDVRDLDKNILPTQFELGQNYPNPFNPTTRFEFAVPEKSNVNISVFNILGQKITTLVDGEYAAGYYSVDWDSRSDNGSEVASGIYFYKIEANNYTNTKKLMLIR
ncbi:MAG: hypothetical protein CVT49_05875 [candidate division Zixibacteria bacterium HGW-Zixibacteria-1]|nr:MAG: hypothetical protein CVT49_05875 [candidate division Zixibacteria bacterium HGW-Zixibacteria-1]